MTNGMTSSVGIFPWIPVLSTANQGSIGQQAWDVEIRGMPWASKRSVASEGALVVSVATDAEVA